MDIDEKQNQIQTIKLVQQNIRQSRTISFQSIQDIEHMRKGQKIKNCPSIHTGHWYDYEFH